eukprot:CAMPEP_0174951786 /NCGR_PEP_ID=MMETSP1355-20121228/95035_1 /TAXON_ID=464990 /ORGANISM="Hemiselmis tepida, Strain CCMP443" /LENGTH=161 /DNA_ID=CAMNT_0016199463 /DNA_START=896 /DNA_END=1381 /DNA_ORIENTATION=-
MLDTLKHLSSATCFQRWNESFLRFSKSRQDVSLGGIFVAPYLLESAQDRCMVTLGGELDSQTASDPDEGVVRAAKRKSLNGCQNAPPGYREIPVVLVGINYQIFQRVPRSPIPFLFERNRRVVVLTDVKQQLEIVNMAADMQHIGLPRSCERGSPHSVVGS